MLDNECSTILKDYIHDKNITLQKTPSAVHRRNAAERAIQTFKNHFVAGLCSTDPQFPLHLWDRLLPQATLTLNHLRQSRLNPTLSAYAQVFGLYDFKANPIAPPGIHVIAYETPPNRGTWDAHGKDGWYLGPTLDSYRTFRVWIWETHGERNVDTLAWFPHNIPMPIATATDLAIASLRDIAQALSDPAVPNSLPLDTTEVETLRDLAAMFDRRNSTITPTIVHSQDKPTTNKQAPPPVRRVPSATQRRTRSMGLLARADELQPTAHTWFTNTFTIDTPAQALKAINPDTQLPADYKELLASSDGHHWENSCSNEFGRLAQGRHPTMPTGTDTIFFIHPSRIPPGRRATYLRIVCDDRPQKTETRRVRHTVGGDKIDYPFAVATKVAGITTVKILINSVISTPDARFMSIDIKDFFLNNPMARYEYIRIPVDIIPQDIMDQYNLHELVVGGYVYVEI